MIFLPIIIKIYYRTPRQKLFMYLLYLVASIDLACLCQGPNLYIIEFFNKCILERILLKWNMLHYSLFNLLLQKPGQLLLRHQYFQNTSQANTGNTFPNFEYLPKLQSDWRSINHLCRSIFSWPWILCAILLCFILHI